MEKLASLLLYLCKTDFRNASALRSGSGMCLFCTGSLIVYKTINITALTETKHHYTTTSTTLPESPPTAALMKE